MRLPEVQANLELTRNDMRAQIGVDVGGPTGACNFVVLGALTGERVDFNNIPSEPRDMIALEQRHGLHRAEVHAPGVFVIDALRILLEQNRIAFNGVIAQGRIEVPRIGSRPHAVAVVVDEQRQPLGIVDSLLEGGLRLIDEDAARPDRITDAGVYLQSRFFPNRSSLSLALNEEQRRQFRGKSLVELANRVSVGLLPPIRES